MLFFPIQAALLDHAQAMWRRQPATRIEDAYKWLFHATQGGDHAVRDDSGPRQWMDREWATLGNPLPDEPLVVPLDPQGRLIRVNLRPYRAMGGDKEMLLALFVASAQEFRPERRTFRAEWRSLGKRLQKHEIGGLTYPEWVRLDRATRAEGYPAIEHSETYLRKAKPAYRVILGSLWVGSRHK